MKEIQLKDKRIVPERLTPFGFKKTGEEYVFKTDILDGQFVLELHVCGLSVVRTRLTEKASAEEYFLHLVEDVTGAFVGSVREEYNAVLDSFAADCCTPDVFKESQTLRVMDYVAKKHGDGPEYLWEKAPGNAVFRRKDVKTWYAVLLTVSRRKLGFDSDEIAEILDLRMQPETLAEVVDGKNVFSGYHMNKRHWITVVLDDTLSDGEIFGFIDNSFCLAGTKKAK